MLHETILHVLRLVGINSFRCQPGYSTHITIQIRYCKPRPVLYHVAQRIRYFYVLASPFRHLSSHSFVYAAFVLPCYTFSNLLATFLSLSILHYSTHFSLRYYLYSYSHFSLSRHSLLSTSPSYTFHLHSLPLRPSAFYNELVAFFQRRLFRYPTPFYLFTALHILRPPLALLLLCSQICPSHSFYCVSFLLVHFSYRYSTAAPSLRFHSAEGHSG